MYTIKIRYFRVPETVQISQGRTYSKDKVRSNTRDDSSLRVAYVTKIRYVRIPETVRVPQVRVYNKDKVRTNTRDGSSLSESRI